MNPLDRCFSEALAAGVTTVMTTPGSANPCGGTMLILKTAGNCVDDMKLTFGGIKFALGENPKSVYHGRDEMPFTRMATAAIIREGLYKAKRYLEQWEAVEEAEDQPDYDAKCEALLPLLRREYKAHFHCHRADDMMTAIRIAKEFHLDAVLVHGTEDTAFRTSFSEQVCRLSAARFSVTAANRNCGIWKSPRQIFCISMAFRLLFAPTTP